jgi:hypothetical protein
MYGVNQGGIMNEEQIKALKELRKPFPEEHISQLPKPTCKKEEYDKLPKGTCKICGGYHATSKTIHLKYVGHAALTDRLLSVDPLWNWEPLAFTDAGLPLFDQSGGMWGKLTVCGITRIGYGHAKPNPFAEVGSREKEVIGDFLRNSGMRFGIALDFWSKADLSVVVDEDEQPGEKIKKEPPPNKDAVQDKSPSLPGREILDQWLNFIDAYTKATLDVFLADWDAKVMPVVRKMPEHFKAEMWAAKKQVEKFLIEKQGVK